MKASPHADLAYLHHILEAGERILDYTQEGRETFLVDRKSQDAVGRNFEIIGEAAKRVSAATRQSFPDIPWKRMAGFRDVLIHGYDRVDVDQVWAAVEADLPPVLHGIRTALDALREA